MVVGKFFLAGGGGGGGANFHYTSKAVVCCCYVLYILPVEILKIGGCFRTSKHPLAYGVAIKKRQALSEEDCQTITAERFPPIKIFDHGCKGI